MGRELTVLSCATPQCHSRGMLLAHAGCREGPAAAVQSTDFPHASLTCWICFTAHTPALPVWPAETAFCHTSSTAGDFWDLFFCVVGHTACFTPCNLKASFSKLRQSSERTSFSTLLTWRVHQRQRFHCGALEYCLQVSVFTVGGNKFHILDHNILNKDIVFAVNLQTMRRVSILKMSSR